MTLLIPRLVSAVRLLLAGTLWLISAVAASAAEPVDYTRDVKPLLAEHCTACHGAEEQQSGLRLDAGKLLLRGGDHGPAIVAGKSGESLLIHALAEGADVPRMPLESDALSEEQVGLVKRWIDEGATFPADEEIVAAKRQGSDHWAFQPVRQVALPDVSDPAWCKSPIDRFILHRLDELSIKPSAEAGRATLIRRLSLDLLGLPPTLDEIEAFARDERPDAYERLVDRLLASPRYGERMARHWLDVARYADSHGYTIDGPRSIWKFRDWVVQSLNVDMPFDEFAIEQLAGDLLPEATTQQIVATGFHRNTLINQEGGTDQEQFRVEAVADRVNTTGVAFLGLTVGCARCHAHKYDPISQREYYQLFQLLNQCDEPEIPVPSREQIARRAELDQKLAAARADLAAYDAKAEERRLEREKQLAALPLDVAWFPLTIEKAASEGGATLKTLDDHSLLTEGKIPGSDLYTVTYVMPVRRGTAIKVEALTHDGLPHKGPGLASNGNFVLTDVRVARRTLEEPDIERPMIIASATADHAQDGFPIEHAFDDDPEKTGWAINVKQGSLNVDRSAVLVFPQALAENDLRLTIRFRFGHPASYQIGRLRVSVTQTPAEVLALPEDIRTALKTPPDQRTPQQTEALRVELQRVDPGRAPLQHVVNGLNDELEALQRSVPMTMVLTRRQQPRETFIHIRGDFLRHGAPVSGGVPGVLPQFPADVKNPTRLDFARWLVDPNNPLTPRVTANRAWQAFFGRGIVATEDDFGTQGEPPTHPDLLDWLASELAARDAWSLKSLHRQIISSATYRQASTVSAEQLAADPFNKWLGRQSRLRIEAESIRDAALAASGAWCGVMYGPGVFPPQPGGIYAFTQNQKNWTASGGGDRFRRGLYTWFWRSSPDPFMTTFDAPNANVACTRRVRSNTPLQALTLANDAMFVELAQALAARIIGESPCVEDAARLRYGFQLCLARQPSAWELERLLAFVQSQRQRSAQTANDAQPADETALWTAAARVLLNLDEFVTRE